MTAAGFVIVWLGYGLTSYGWVLTKGYNITIRQWFSPLNPLIWSEFSTSDLVQPGQIFPGQSASQSNSSGTSGTAGTVGQAESQPQGPLSTTVPASGTSLADEIKNAAENALKQLFIGGFR